MVTTSAEMTHKTDNSQPSSPQLVSWDDVFGWLVSIGVHSVVLLKHMHCLLKSIHAFLACAEGPHLAVLLPPGKCGCVLPVKLTMPGVWLRCVPRQCLPSCVHWLPVQRAGTSKAPALLSSCVTEPTVTQLEALRGTRLTACVCIAGVGMCRGCTVQRCGDSMTPSILCKAEPTPIELIASHQAAQAQMSVCQHLPRDYQ